MVFLVLVSVSAKLSTREDSELQNFIGAKGNVFLSNGEFEAAERAFRTLVRSAPHSWPAHYAMASALLNQCRCRTVHRHNAAFFLLCITCIPLYTVLPADSRWQRGPSHMLWHLFW